MLTRVACTECNMWFVAVPTARRQHAKSRQKKPQATRARKAADKDTGTMCIATLCCGNASCAWLAAPFSQVVCWVMQSSCRTAGSASNGVVRVDWCLVTCRHLGVVPALMTKVFMARKVSGIDLQW